MNKLIAEYIFYKKLITETVPSGPLSLVGDSFDFWGVVTKVVPALKGEIMDRDGTLVIRPDSGDPVDILCGIELFDIASSEFTGSYSELYAAGFKYLSSCGGDRNVEIDANGEVVRSIPECEAKGLIECLWDTFGGTKTDKGFRVLDSHIGAIYGDSITLERQKQIADRLMEKGFAPNVVLGIGSYTYQYVTRDTHGSAVKATNVVKAGKDVGIAKDPLTDRSKKSARGLLRVEIDPDNGQYVMHDEQSREEEALGCLETIFLDGKIVKETTLSEIRARLQSTL